jgi:D-alanine-D-alanine ligase
VKTKAKILICYNAPVSIFSVYNGKPVNDFPGDADTSEKSFIKELNSVRESLSKYFNEVEVLAIEKNVKKTINTLKSINPDVIFNFVESVEGVASLEWCIAGLFGLLGYEFTGCVPSCLGNCLNKARTKSILKAEGLNTPNYKILDPSEKISENDFDLKYPVILKLLQEDASIGISEFSVVQDFNQLNKQFRFLAETYKQPVIAEEYIDGRELNVAILGNKVLPVSEINFTGLPDGLPKIVTYEGKWIENSLYYDNTKPVCPANINGRLKERIESLAMSAFEVMNCRDYARVDIRLDKNEIPWIIEVNPNPDISSDSGFARAAAASGLSHSELLYTIANFALNRKKINDTKVKAS